MDRTQEIKDAYPWLSYDEVVKVLLYHHQGSIWIQNLERDNPRRSMEKRSQSLLTQSRKTFNPFRVRSRSVL